jgi:hypothetical protein
MQKAQLKKEISKLFKSLDFVSKNFLNQKKASRKTLDTYFTIYQQLGLAWEFLGLQCKHWDGYRTTRDKKEVCKICGKVRDAGESYYLLPVEGRKTIGSRVLPNSKKVFPTKAKATIINDTLTFHGALLNVEVTNSYKSSLFNKSHEITVAADRIVTLQERGIECRIDQHLIDVQVEKRKKGETVYGGFPWEIKRKGLKNFPVIFEFDSKYTFLGLTILR